MNKHIGSDFRDAYRKFVKNDPKMDLEIQIMVAKLEVGNLLISQREDRGLTQKQLADKLGVKQQLISKIESGSNNITLDTLIRVLTVLGVALKVEKIKLERAKRVLQFVQ